MSGPHDSHKRVNKNIKASCTKRDPKVGEKVRTRVAKAIDARRGHGAPIAVGPEAARVAPSKALAPGARAALALGRVGGRLNFSAALCQRVLLEQRGRAAADLRAQAPWHCGELIVMIS